MRSILTALLFVTVACGDKAPAFSSIDGGNDTDDESSTGSATDIQDTATGTDTVGTDTSTETETGQSTDTEDTGSETEQNTDTEDTETEQSTETGDTDTQTYGNIAYIRGKVILPEYYYDEYDDNYGGLGMGCVQVLVTSTYPQDIATFNIADDIEDKTYHSVYVEDVKAGRSFSFNIDRRNEKPGTYWVKAVYSPWNDCNGANYDTFYSFTDGCPSFELTGKPYSGLEVILNQYRPKP